MTHEELKLLFRQMSKYPSLNKVPKRYLHGISLSTLQRWAKQGLDKTIKKSFGYCKTCSSFFQKTQSTQILCGSRKCYLAHAAYMSKMRHDQVGRKKPISVKGMITKSAKRRVTMNRATNSGSRYTDKEIELVRYSPKSIFDLAIKLGRSMSSIEGLRTRINKRKKDEESTDERDCR